MKAEETTDRLYSGRAFQRDDWKVRISKTVGRRTGGGLWQLMGSNTFLYDSWNLIKERSTLTATPSTNFYVWGLDLSGSLQGAGGIGGLLAAQLGTNSVLYTYDGNGNVSELINTLDNTIAAHYEYSPFGEVLVATGDLAGDNPFQFSTKYFDSETGLNNYGYRYYSPSLGRWVCRDPILEKAFQDVRPLTIAVTAQDLELLRWQQMLVARGFLRDESVIDSNAWMPANRSQLEYVFLANVPIDQVDILGLGYCGSAGNEELVPELWFGGENGPCHKHDQCYDTCGYSQEYCNGLFLRDMIKACPLWPPEAAATCFAAASWYYAAVQNLGKGPFCEAQKACCPKGEPVWGTCP